MSHERFSVPEKRIPSRQLGQGQNKYVVRGKEPAPTSRNIFRGHRGNINSLTFHPHLETIYSAGEDNTVMSWNFKKESRALRFEGHTAAVNDISLSQDGDLMISASDDFTVRVRVPTINGEFISIKAHSAAVQSATFSPVNSSQFATCSNDKSIKIWSVQHARSNKSNSTRLKTHNFLTSFSNHTNWVRTVRYSKDGRLLCSSSDDKTIRLYDLRSNLCTSKIDCATGVPTKADFNPCGVSYIGVSTTENSFLIYDVRMVKLLQSYTNLCENSINSFAFHPGGDFAVTVSEDAKIKILDLIEGRPIFTLFGAREGLLATAFSPDGSLFATGGKDKEIIVWEPTLLPYEEEIHGASTVAHSSSFVSS